MSAGGWLFTVFNRNLSVSLSAFTWFLSFICVPFMRTLDELYVQSTIMGIAQSAMDVAVNPWVLEIWQLAANPYMQSMHFCYAIGITVGPVVAAPFLSPNHNSTIPTFDNVTMTPPFNVTDTATRDQFRWPFYITAALALVSVVPPLLLHFIQPYKPIRQQQQAAKKTEYNLTVKYYLTVVALAGGLLCMESAGEAIPNTYGEAYVIRLKNPLSKQAGAYLNTVSS